MKSARDVKPTSQSTFRLLRRRLIGRLIRLYRRASRKIAPTERYRFQAYLLGVLITMLVCLFFAFYQIVHRHVVMGLLDLLMAAFLMGCGWFLLISRRAYVIYRLSVYAGILLLLYMLSEGLGTEGTILWMYIIPPIAFFLLHPREALAAMLVSSVGISSIFAGVPLFFVTPAAYPATLQFRFWASYALVSLFCYIYETVRDHFQTRFLQEQAKLRQEIQERARLEQHLIHSLHEKEILLKEIHHRVKNNLQIISSVLNLQAALLPNEQDREMFQESQRRVRTMALIHEKLYQSGDLSRIDVREYITTLVRELVASYQRPDAVIDVVFDLADAFWEIDTAIPCGLIINELVSDTLKYAFPAGHGTLTIRLATPTSGGYELVVSDNGVGLPDGFDLTQLESLGLQLVQGLVEEQLSGQLEVVSQPGQGTTWRIMIR